ncbi:hypothetical protein MKW98_020804 [Papaver atlanticum]|uniref:WRKY domain-containing protein n=1 Tax=Papaver atlanticum TaxID=357466 RepID=A0AAD4XYE3_9MAGN|nr:hypothetical protein MKW98_020804 [Papaver atlanticum]
MTSSGGGGRSSGLDTTTTTSSIEYPNFSFSTSSNSTNHQFMNSSSFSDLLATNNHTTDSPFSNRGSGGYADRIGSGGGGVPKFKSTPPPSLPISPPSLAVSPSSYFSIPPGLSPAELLDSPVLLSSSNILPSPTTGSFPAHNPSFNWSSNNNTIKQETERRNTNYSIVTSSSSLASSNDFSFQTQSWNSNSISSDNHNQRNIVKSEFPPPLLQGFSSLPPDHQFSSSSSTTTQKIQPTIHHQTLREKRRSEDGYNWRKYGQKQVKGSENPRSYYKCTFQNCPTKKKVERSLEGQITEIVYKGSHNHPKPTSTRRSSSSSLQSSSSLPSLQQQPPLSSSSSIVVSALPISSDNNHGGNSSSQMELVTTPENSSNISVGDEVDFDHSSDHKSKSNGYDFDDHHDQEPEAKRWKRVSENEVEGISAPPAGSRTVREPRVVVQTTSDIDILDDGYRWRKYGQKVVKGNPNPRSYYKCTSIECPVRKHVERASHDLQAVITTYEGKHNHDVPAARGSGMNRQHQQQQQQSAAATTTMGSSHNNGSSVVRPNTTSLVNNVNNNNNNHSYRNDNQGGQAPFTLEMLQTSPGSFGFSGFSMDTNNSFMNNQPQQGFFSKTKDEPRDDMFLESLLF